MSPSESQGAGGTECEENPLAVDHCQNVAFVVVLLLTIVSAQLLVFILSFLLNGAQM